MTEIPSPGVPLADGEGFGLTPSLGADGRDPSTWPRLDATVVDPLGTQP
jgi:hypothetical protein